VGWNYCDCRGSFFPDRLPRAGMVDVLRQQSNSVGVNCFFYRSSIASLPSRFAAFIPRGRRQYRNCWNETLRLCKISKDRTGHCGRVRPKRSPGYAFRGCSSRAVGYGLGRFSRLRTDSRNKLFSSRRGVPFFVQLRPSGFSTRTSGSPTSVSGGG
jgi:hypothetical protein